MTIGAADRVAITDLIALHGHLMDDGELERMDELFTPDVAYDLSAFGLGVVRGVAALKASALALGAGNPVGHHVTNVLLTAVDADTVTVRSKAIGISADGTAGSLIYDDTVVRTDAGWRIAARTITPRRTPLGGRTA